MAQILNTTYFLSVENDNPKWQIVEFSTIFFDGFPNQRGVYFGKICCAGNIDWFITNPQNRTIAKHYKADKILQNLRINKILNFWLQKSSQFECFPEILHLGLASTTVGTRTTEDRNQF